MSKLIPIIILALTIFPRASALAMEPKAALKEMARLQASLKKEPENVALLCSLARLDFFVAKGEKEKDKRLSYYRSCQGFARRAMAINDKSAQAHFWLGICYGKEAREAGWLSGLALVGSIKKEFERVIELDPAYNDSGGHRALGRMLTKLPGIMGGSLKKARIHLKEAVRIAPGFSTNHLYLAEVYLGLKEYDLAYRELLAVFTLPCAPDRRKTVMEEREKAKGLMKKVPEKVRKRLGGKLEFER